MLAGGGGGFAGRFANGMGISLGPLGFGVYSIDLGSLAAMGMPAAVLLALRTRSRLARLIYVAMVLAFAAVLGFTGARGAMIGAAAGTLVALLVSRRLTLSRAVVGLLILVVVLAVAGSRLLELLPSGAVSRVVALRGGLGSTSISASALASGVQRWPASSVTLSDRGSTSSPGSTIWTNGPWRTR